MKYTGRPPKYDNPEDMQKIIVKYFNECDYKGRTGRRKMWIRIFI